MNEQVEREQIKQLRREELARARSMTPSERLTMALDLFEMGCQLMEAGLRSQHPNATSAEIESMLRQRLHRARLRKEFA